MKNFSQRIVEKFRNIKDDNLSASGKFFLKLRMTPNMMTSLSLVLGLGAIYFLFSNYLWFAVLSVFHLLADGLDGVIARVSKESRFGKYFDYFSDQLIVLLLLIKIYFYLQDYYVILITILFILSHVIYFFSKLRSPIVFLRTSGVVILIFYPLFPLRPFLTACYLLGGIFTIFTLSLQLKYLLEARKSR